MASHTFHLFFIILRKGFKNRNRYLKRRRKKSRLSLISNRYRWEFFVSFMDFMRKEKIEIWNGDNFIFVRTLATVDTITCTFNASPISKSLEKNNNICIYTSRSINKSFRYNSLLQCLCLNIQSVYILYIWLPKRVYILVHTWQNQSRSIWIKYLKRRFIFSSSLFVVCLNFIYFLFFLYTNHFFFLENSICKNNEWNIPKNSRNFCVWFFLWMNLVIVSNCIALWSGQNKLLAIPFKPNIVSGPH